MNKLNKKMKFLLIFLNNRNFKNYNNKFMIINKNHPLIMNYKRKLNNKI